MRAKKYLVKFFYDENEMEDWLNLKYEHGYRLLTVSSCGPPSRHTVVMQSRDGEDIPPGPDAEQTF